MKLILLACTLGLIGTVNSFADGTNDLVDVRVCIGSEAKVFIDNTFHPVSSASGETCTSMKLSRGTHEYNIVTKGLSGRRWLGHIDRTASPLSGGDWWGEPGVEISRLQDLSGMISPDGDDVASGYLEL